MAAAEPYGIVDYDHVRPTVDAAVFVVMMNRSYVRWASDREPQLLFFFHHFANKNRLEKYNLSSLLSFFYFFEKGKMMVVIDFIAMFYAAAAVTAGSMFVYHNSGARKH